MMYTPTGWAPPCRNIHATSTGRTAAPQDAKTFSQVKNKGKSLAIFGYRVYIRQTPPYMPTVIWGGGGDREGTHTQEGQYPIGRSPHAPEGRLNASFHRSGARAQVLGPYPQCNKVIGTKRGGKDLGHSPCKYSPLGGDI